MDFDALRRQLLAESARRGWAELWPEVMAARARLLRSYLNIAPEKRDTPGAGGGEEGWSPRQVGLHVIAYTRNVSAIIEATAVGQTAPKDPPGTLPEEGQVDGAGEPYPVLFEESERLAVLHQRLPAAPDMQTTVPHALLGPLPSRAWYLFLRIHDGDHAGQLERLAGGG